MVSRETFRAGNLYFILDQSGELIYWQCQHRHPASLILKKQNSQNVKPSIVDEMIELPQKNLIQPHWQKLKQLCCCWGSDCHLHDNKMHLSLSVNDSGCSAITFCLSAWIPAGWMKMKQPKHSFCWIFFILNPDHLKRMLTRPPISAYSYFIVGKHYFLFTVAEGSSADGSAEVLWSQTLVNCPFYLVGFNGLAQSRFPWRCVKCLVYSGRVVTGCEAACKHLIPNEWDPLGWKAGLSDVAKNMIRN